jgi:transposase
MAAGKKNAERLGAYLVFLDESGFLLIPPVQRTWAPRGHTPRFYHPLRHDRISAISAISVSPKRKHLGLYYQLYDHNICQDDIVAFLRHLLRHLPGPVIVLLDNYKPHKARALLRLCQQHSRLHLEYFPAYAPELNPDEGVWTNLRRHFTNRSLLDWDDLLEETLAALETLRRSPRLLRGCIHQSDLPTFLP